MRTEVVGTAPNRQLRDRVAQRRASSATRRRAVDFEVVLHENGQILTQYRNIGRRRPGAGQLGHRRHRERRRARSALQYSFGEPSLPNNFAVLYRPPPPASYSFFTVTPCRLADTRNPPGPFGAPALSNGVVRTFTVGGNCGVPAAASAVSVNLTSSRTAAHLTLYSAMCRTKHSNINFTPAERQQRVLTLSASRDDCRPARRHRNASTSSSLNATSSERTTSPHARAPQLAATTRLPQAAAAAHLIPPVYPPQ